MLHGWSRRGDVIVVVFMIHRNTILTPFCGRRSHCRSRNDLSAGTKTCSCSTRWPSALREPSVDVATASASTRSSGKLSTCGRAGNSVATHEIRQKMVYGKATVISKKRTER